jgi:hypothetical protein
MPIAQAAMQSQAAIGASNRHLKYFGAPWDAHSKYFEWVSWMVWDVLIWKEEQF